MEDKERKIRDRLKSDFEYVASLGHNVLGTFLQGSQNYNLDYEGSDIDTKSITIPSFKDFILNKQPLSKTYVLETNEHADAKDIRIMFECFKKQNINFLEILFTKYYYLNPVYADLYQPVLDRAEEIAHYNNYAAVNCIAGMVFEKRAALCHPYPTLKDRIEKYGYDRKQLHHILRCEEFLNRFIAGESYRDCLIPKNPDYLRRVKSDPEFISLDTAIQMADEAVNRVRNKKQEYMDTTEVIVNKEVEKLLTDTLYNVFKRSFKNEILDEE